MTLATLVSIGNFPTIQMTSPNTSRTTTIDETIKRIIWAVLLVAAVIWLLTQLLGVGWFTFR